MRELLGGKGANLAEMTRILGPLRVPAGFTITTQACVSYMSSGGGPEGLEEQIAAALTRLEEHAGRRFGDPDDPLLVSVRSGARASMPGMMDTILNLGLNDESVLGLARSTGNERFAWDSYRRLVQMYGNVVMGVPSEEFEKAIRRVKQHAGSAWTPSSTPRPCVSSSRRSSASTPRRRLPARSAAAAARRSRRGVRLVDGPARR